MLDTTTIRISVETREIARALSEEMSTPLSTVVDRALKLLRKERLLASADIAYRTLKADPEKAAEFEAEQQTWDETLTDGLLGE